MFKVGFQQAKWRLWSIWERKHDEQASQTENGEPIGTAQQDHKSIGAEKLKMAERFLSRGVT